jgi:1-acyl-sn-glycerol-3-phosphate acyltransferase
MKRYTLPRILQSIMHPPVRFYLKQRHDLKIYGGEFVRSVPGPVIVVANHPGYALDIFSIAVALRIAAPQSPIHRPLLYLTREYQYYRRLRDKYAYTMFRSLGGIPVHIARGNLHKSLSKMLSAISFGYSVCIFPEEGMGEKKKVKQGVSFLCEKSGAPTLPVKISYGTDRRISVYFGPHIPAEYMQFIGGDAPFNRSHQEIAERLMALIYRLGE